MPKARAAAQRAVELDGNLAEAHTALALIVQNYDWDWKTAEQEFRRAIELNPNYATAHHWYAEHLTWLGRFEEALRESERARQLDPLSLIIAADNGATLYYSRQYDQAIAKFRAVRELDPTFPRTGVIRQPTCRKVYSIMLLKKSKSGATPMAINPGRGRNWRTFMAAPASSQKPLMHSKNCLSGISGSRLILLLLRGPTSE